MAREITMVIDRGILRITYPATWSSDHFRWAAVQYVELLEEQRRIGRRLPVLFDMSQAGVPNPVERRMIADLLKDNEQLVKDVAVRWALVIDSMAIRGVITALQWFLPAPVSTKAFATLEEAEAWCVLGE